MNQKVLDFFKQNYAPGRIGLIGATDAIGKLIRGGQAGLTPDKKPSRWSHSFILGEKRSDGRTDGGLYIFESDLNINPKDLQIQNGAMESRLVKWCRDDVENACVLGLNLTLQESDQIVSEALQLAYAYYDHEPHLKYPLGELFGTLWAILTKRLNKKNVFDDKYAVQCATYVRMVYQKIGKDPLPGGGVDLTHTSPEKLFQSPVLTFKQVMP